METANTKPNDKIQSNIPFVHTIAFRSMIVFAMVFFIILAGGGIFLVYAQMNSFQKNASKEKQLATKQALEQISTQCNIFIGRLSLLATSPYLSNQDPIESSSFLKGYNVSPLFIPGEHVVLHNSNHEKVSDNSMVGISQINVSYQELKNFQAVEPQKPYISPLFWEQRTPKKIMAVLVENRARSDGYLSASFSIRRLWEFFENYSTGKKGFFIIVDESDVIVYHPQIQEWANGEKKVQDLGLKDFDAKTFKASQDFYRLNDGKDYLINYEYDPKTKFGVLALQSKSEVMAPAQAYFQIFIYIGLVFLIATLCITLWLFFSIEKPLQKLIKKMLIIADGHYEESSGITGDKQNEIHVLARVFDKMRLTIQKEINALAEHQAHLEQEVLKRTEELNKMNQQLQIISRIDELTKLPNRRDIREKIQNEIYRYERTNRNFSILFVDIDKFKDFNDKFGHICGDLVLKTVAETLRDQLRKQDVVSRWGGEEFLVMLPETPLQGASLVAERLRRSIENRKIEFAGQQQHVTITLGVAEYDKRLGMDHSINLADLALYNGKQTGRNKVVVFDPKDITEDDLKAAQEELQFAAQNPDTKEKT